MQELIDRVAFREHLDSVYPFTKAGQQIAANNFAKTILLCEMAKFPTHAPAPKWISVEDQLPEDGANVLCLYEYFRYGDFNCMFRSIDRGYFINGRFGGEPTMGHKAKVLYWMPLPPFPEELRK